jgi:retron-type reverse transcriptase
MSWIRRFFAWLWKLLFVRGPIERRAPLLGGGTDADSIRDRARKKKEIVDLSGGPIKPHHQRRALRDPRLLPKPGRKNPFEKPPRVMKKEEARRLFSSTLRTRNRNLFDLLPDEEQLARHALPLWKTEEDLAKALGLSLGELRFFSIHRECERADHYVTFAIPKRSGGERCIMAPKKRLKAVQRSLNQLLCAKLPVSEHAHAFLPRRSVKTNAEPHVGRRALLQLDLESFFPSVTFARVRGFLISLGYGYPVATVLSTLMTACERQPVEIAGEVLHVPVGPRVCVQGAPTSPLICNAICLKLDRRLAGLAKKLGFEYTRYADDLTFSGDDAGKVARLHRIAREIIEDEGFRLNAKKTRILRRGRRQRVTGVTVNDVLGLSRKERRRLRAMAHRAQQNPEASVKRRVAGHVAYLGMLNPEQAGRIRRNRD